MSNKDPRRLKRGVIKPKTSAPIPRIAHPFFAGEPDTPHLAESPLYWVIGHRGTNTVYAENSLPAFAYALTSGARMIELDVRLTACGSVVVIHDATVDSTTNGTGAVKQMSLAQLKSLDLQGGENSAHLKNSAHSQVPTLEEVFSAFPDAKIAVELKDADWVLCRKVYELIAKYNRFEKTLVQLFSITHKLGKRFRRLDKRLLTGHTATEGLRLIALAKLHLASKYAIRRSPPVIELPMKRGRLKLVTPTFVKAAHRLGIRVFVWTVNDAATIEKLFAMGVDGIYTDDPHFALQKISSLKLQKK